MLSLTTPFLCTKKLTVILVTLSLATNMGRTSSDFLSIKQ